jgi:HEAT repeat protein
VAIVPSRAKRIQDLVGQLQSERGAFWESAVAQLTLLGPRAVEPLLAALGAAHRRTRLGALEVLDRLRDPRALSGVLLLTRDPDPEVAEKALELAGAYPHARAVSSLVRALDQDSLPRRRAAALSLARIQAAGVVEAIDPLLGVLLDEEEDEELRLTVLRALSGPDTPIAAKTLRPLLERLQPSAAPALAREAKALRNRLEGTAQEPGDRLDRLLSRLGGVSSAAEPALFRELGSLGPPAAEALVEALLASAEVEPAQRIGRALRDFPPAIVDVLHWALARSPRLLAVRILADVLGHYGRPGSIPALHQALKQLSTPEGGGAEVAATRARIHLALAALDSRIALYNLREMLEAGPSRALPDLLAAARRIGDGSLLPGLARLVSEAPTAREACADAFIAISRRHRLRRNSAALRAVKPAHGKALDWLWMRVRTG